MADKDLLSSSDDEELLAGFPVRTTPEIRAGDMRMIANIGDSLNRIKMDSNTAFSSLGTLERTIGQCLSCKVCGEVARVPFILECGHVYCFECLANRLEATRSQFSRGRCWNPLPHGDHVRALRKPMDNPRLYLGAMEWLRDNPTPNYSCHFCHKSITRKPIQDFTLQTIAEGFGQDREEGACGGNTRQRTVDLDSFFDKYLLF